MKVALVFMHPFSESMGSFVRVRELALSLGKFGVEAYIFTPYEFSFDLSPRVHVVSTTSFINTIGVSKTIYRLSKLLYYNKAFPKFFSKIESRYNRIMAAMINSIAKSILKKGINLIQVEQDVALPIGIGLKKETGLPLIGDIHNVSSEELVATGILEKNSSDFLELQDATKKCLSETDYTVVVSEDMRNYVINNYDLNSDFVSVVPPGGRLNGNIPILRQHDSIPKVVYAGLVAHRERVDLFVESMPFVLKHNFVQFYITNKGEAIQKIKKLVRKLGVNPTFFWYDKYYETNKFLSLCHLGVLPSSNDIARRMGTPAKLFNYMSVGLPVVANNIGGWTKIIEEEEIGLVTDGDDPADFALAINKLLGDANLRITMSYNALKAIKEKYSWDKSAEVLVKVYENLS